MGDEAGKVVIIGAGLTGATAAHALGRAGHQVTVYEGATRVGGHVRNEWMRGIPYEPNGAHIFHTDDEAVWRLATSITEFLPYEHRVLTRVEGQLLSWPIQLEEVRGLPQWPTIERELAARPPAADPTNFETWCVSIMGRTLYDLFIADYTRKQWGREPSQLSTEFAPNRVELRTDGYRGLFRDPHQGWPRLGYDALVDGLLADTEVVLGTPVDAASLPHLVEPGATVVVTSPLDHFFGDVEGELEWRGVNLVPRYLPGVRHHQPASVVNEPGATVPYTRIIETKHVFPDLDGVEGTVICEEYPGAPSKHYPVYDVDGVNRAIQTRYLARLEGHTGHSLFAAGRLANYLYINMDEAMRQGLDVAARVSASVAAGA